MSSLNITIPEIAEADAISNERLNKRGEEDHVFKMIALPCSVKYEPLTYNLLKHIQTEEALGE